MIPIQAHSASGDTVRSKQPGDVPGSLMAEYYGQRASAGGLIVTESAEIAPDASAYEGAPGIYTDAQVTGWRGVVEAVHARELAQLRQATVTALRERFERAVQVGDLPEGTDCATLAWYTATVLNGLAVRLSTL